MYSVSFFLKWNSYLPEMIKVDYSKTQHEGVGIVSIEQPNNNEVLTCFKLNRMRKNW